MQKIELPTEIKVPGVVWIVLMVGIGWWVTENVANPEVVNLVVMGVGVVLRTLVNNDAALEKAASAGQTVLDYFARKREFVAASKPEAGMRSGAVVPLEPPLPVVERVEPPNKVVSWLFG